MNVRIYVEGGGDTSALRAKCREAFRKLLEKAGLSGSMPRIVACGSRRDTYDAFRTAHGVRGEDDYPILLVDGEGLVSQPPWEHLKEQDRWERPQDAEEEQAQLMVACMEAWVMADREALRRVFRPGLRENALLPVDGLEQREKDAVQQKLEDATRGCPRERRYQKGRRSFQVVEELDPRTLEGDPTRPRLPHFKRLMDTLRGKV